MAHDLEALKGSLVEMGTTRIAHLDGTLLAHMENVYRNLERLGRREPLMLAGLFHGVYGTHALHSSDVFELPEEKRGQVRSLVGEESERLVHTFCVMTYESLGKSLRSVLRPGGQAELWDRCGRAPIHLSREQFDDLLWVKLADLLAHVPQLSVETKATAVADFGPVWQLVAEPLGPAAVDGWNEALGDVAMIKKVRGPVARRRT
jgi:hypothetical protein